MKNVGLVLSGGGVRGMAHLGVIKALEEKQIRVRQIAGASIGAVVGAFYAAGHSWEHTLEFFKTTPMFTWQNYTYSKPGLLDTDRFHSVFAAHLPDDNFHSLERKLFISTTDICAGKNCIFKEGRLIQPILASAAVPMVLSPVLIDGIYYADGGITDNFPLEPLEEECDYIIGSYVNPLDNIEPEELNSSMAVLDRAFKIGVVTLSERKFSDCDLLIAPPGLDQVGTFSLNRIDEVFEMGYSAAMEALAAAPSLPSVS
ncbi:MAG: patatin-like phospholipase family protein [Bacteroidota bacterium]